MIYKSKVDIVYESVLDSIIGGQYKQGDKIVISRIAKEFGISEIPVREALRRLESEGYIKIVANQGAIVDGLDKDSITNIIHIKAVLEGYAARLAIDTLGDEDIADLKSINEKMKNLENSPELELNREFHFRMYERIPNPELFEMISNLWNKWTRTKTVFSIYKKNREQSVLEHDELIRLIESKDYDGLEKAMRAHNMRSGENLITNLQ